MLTDTIKIVIISPHRPAEEQLCSAFVVHLIVLFDQTNVQLVSGSKILCSEWLQQHNPDYSDIVISEENLNTLPEDSIPDSIMVI